MSNSKHFHLGLILLLCFRTSQDILFFPFHKGEVAHRGKNFYILEDLEQTYIVRFEVIRSTQLIIQLLDFLDIQEYNYLVFFNQMNTIVLSNIY